MEYYDTRSSQLIAIDANGNDAFFEEGGLYLQGLDGTAPFSRPVTLKVEVFRHDVWTLGAENILR